MKTTDATAMRMATTPTTTPTMNAGELPPFL
jgi:hypothetical protein